MANKIVEVVDGVVCTPEEVAVEVILEVGKEVLDTIKDIAVTKITEAEATERIRLKMRTLTKINQDRCKTIVELCKEYSKCYMQNLQVNAEAAKDYRDKAHEVVMFFVQNNIEPSNVYMQIVERYLNDSMAILQSNKLKEETYLQTMQISTIDMN